MFQRPSQTIALNREPEEKNEKDFNGSQDTVETVVGPSVQVEGDFVSEGNIIVKGIVSGSVRTSRLLSVEEGAKIIANVKAGSAVISGEIKGNVKVDETLEFTSTARIAGDVECTTLIVAAGALLYGKVSMNGIEIEAPKNRRASTRSKMKVDSDDLMSGGESEE